MNTATEVRATSEPVPMRAALMDLAPVIAIGAFATACVGHCAFSAGGWDACMALVRSMFS